MPSPFPGMNPYFEQPGVWQDFHTEFLSAFRRLLAPRVAPRYIVQLEEHLYIHDIPPEPRHRAGIADLSVARAEPAGRAGAAVGVVDAPERVELPAEEVERVRFLEVRDRLGRELVVEIELLSPSKKRPADDREQYLAKRRSILKTPAHLVEIDLLRGGPPMPLARRPPRDYSALVSRSDARPAADFRPIRLRDRLPTIGVPLRDPDEAVAIDLQAVLHHAHDGPGDGHFLCNGTPQPPLAPEDAAGARALVPAAG